MNPRTIELLAPAKNADAGISAINYGADAVYIGAEKFSARAAAANTAADIERLAAYAHRYSARVYAAFNTILFDHELEEARKLINDLYSAGIDALIIQDMGILEMDLPPVAIHASTQAENSSPDRIRFLDMAGVKRVVLARELSIGEIREIRRSVTCELEFFIHGALCVSFSGNCYMSAASGGRSANRGECAQPCRKEWSLVTGNGSVISRGHLLSTKDLDHTANISELIDAGIDSFKIEGRLKDIHYVKNITAHYRKTLDRILEGRHDLKKSSAGTVSFDFTPDPGRTFNRGYTEYFLHGRTGSVCSFSSPKFTGRKTATVTGINANSFTVDAVEPLNNGDGLAFTGSKGGMKGIRVNRVEGNRIFPFDMNSIFEGAVLYRNHDTAFEKALDESRTERRVAVDMELTVRGDNIILTLTDEEGHAVTLESPMPGDRKESATDPESGIMRHLKKLGTTMFSPRSIDIRGAGNFYIPPALLNDLRRRAASALEQKRILEYTPLRRQIPVTDHPYPAAEPDFRFNVSNRLASRFYERHGVRNIQPAFECVKPRGEVQLMRTKLCLKYETGNCPVYNKKEGLNLPLYITDGKNRYRLEFNCSECLMIIYGTGS